MKIIDLNREQDIGANCLYLNLGPFHVVLESGLHPKLAGRSALPKFELLRKIPVDVVCVSHCHLDHLGSLPVLMREHPSARVLMTPASFDIAPILLKNSYSVMLRQREELGLNELPLYGKQDIDYLSRNYVAMPYGRPQLFTKGNEKLEITFFNAGHVVGAAGVRIVYKHRKIFYTGDVLFRRQYTIDGAKFPEEKWDTLIMETTRGATDVTTEVSQETERLVASIADTLQRGGSCLIPVFALGRMQEVFSILHEARKSKKLPRCPIYASGLGMALAEPFDAISRRNEGQVRFRNKIVRELGVKSLNGRKIKPGTDPFPGSVYVLSSGMLVENTPSYVLAASLLKEPKNSVYFVGYCDQETPGGKLQATLSDDPFLFTELDYMTPVRAEVEKFDLSGHATREELLQLVEKHTPRAVVLTHGEMPARTWFQTQLAAKHPDVKVCIPELGQAVEI